MNYIRLKSNVVKLDDAYKSNTNSLDIITDSIDSLNKNKDFLAFKLDDFSTKISFCGIKIVLVDNPNLFIRNVLGSNEIYSNIWINDTLIKKKNILHINSFSRVNDFLNSKKNNLFHEYLKKNNVEIVDHDIQNFVLKSFFNIKDDNLEKLVDMNFSGISLLDSIDIKDDFIESDNITSLLNIVKMSSTDKKLLIFNNFFLITIDNLIKYYIQDFNILIVVSNLDELITNKHYLELIVIINSFVNNKFKIDALEIADANLLFKYLEKNIKNNKDKLKKYIEIINQS